MNRYLLITISIFQCLLVVAQPKGMVISAGGQSVNGGSSLSWSLGQIITSTFSSHAKSLILTEGFQEKLIVTSVEENSAIPVNIHLYPNPASEVINIHFEAAVKGELLLSLLDFSGRLVRREVVEPSIADKQINLRNIPSGVYILRLTNGSIINIFKVVKL